MVSKENLFAERKFYMSVQEWYEKYKRPNKTERLETKQATKLANEIKNLKTSNG